MHLPAGWLAGWLSGGWDAIVGTCVGSWWQGVGLFSGPNLCPSFLSVVLGAPLGSCWGGHLGKVYSPPEAPGTRGSLRSLGAEPGWRERALSCSGLRGCPAFPPQTPDFESRAVLMKLGAIRSPSR